MESPSLPQCQGVPLPQQWCLGIVHCHGRCHWFPHHCALLGGSPPHAPQAGAKRRRYEGLTTPSSSMLPYTLPIPAVVPAVAAAGLLNSHPSIVPNMALGGPDGPLEVTANDDALLLSSASSTAVAEETCACGKAMALSTAIKKLDFWLLYFVLFVCMSSGLTVINQVSQMAKAIHSDDAILLVTIIGMCNCYGRASAGMLCDSFHIPYPLMLLVRRCPLLTALHPPALPHPFHVLHSLVSRLRLCVAFKPWQASSSPPAHNQHCLLAALCLAWRMAYAGPSRQRWLPLCLARGALVAFMECSLPLLPLAATCSMPCWCQSE